jgi:hypothetical protein
MQAEISVSFVLYLSFLEQVKVWHLKWFQIFVGCWMNYFSYSAHFFY